MCGRLCVVRVLMRRRTQQPCRSLCTVLKDCGQYTRPCAKVKLTFSPSFSCRQWINTRLKTRDSRTQWNDARLEARSPISGERTYGREREPRKRRKNVKMQHTEVSFMLQFCGHRSSRTLQTETFSQATMAWTYPILAPTWKNCSMNDTHTRKTRQW